VTSFGARCLVDDQRYRARRPATHLRRLTDDRRSPLARQRQTNVHVVVISRPYEPRLRRRGQESELTPGEEHQETYGYHLLRKGDHITETPARLGTRLNLDKARSDRAVTVEWCGLTNEASPPFALLEPATLVVLADWPDDFSWTHDRWLASQVGPMGCLEVETAATAKVSRRELLFRDFALEASMEARW